MASKTCRTDQQQQQCSQNYQHDDQCCNMQVFCLWATATDSPGTAAVAAVHAAEHKAQRLHVGATAQPTCGHSSSAPQAPLFARDRCHMSPWWVAALQGWHEQPAETDEQLNSRTPSDVYKHKSLTLD